MKLSSASLELQTIKTICAGKKASKLLCGRVDTEMFHLASARAAYSRILTYMKNGNEPPKYSVLVEDPIIPEKNRNELRKFKKEEFDSNQVNEVIESLRKYAALRKLVIISEKVVQKLQEDHVDVDSLINKITDEITQIRTGKSESKVWKFGTDSNIKPLIEEIMNGNGIKGIPTTFETWDKVNGVIPNTACMLIAATTGGGKSLAASVMCRNLASYGFRPIIVPLEMSPGEMLARLFASVSKVPIENIMQNKLSNNERKKIIKSFNKWHEKCKSNNGSYMIYEPASTPTMVNLLYEVKPYQPDIIIIDYVALLDGVDGDNDWRQLSEAVREAKRFAMNNKIPIIVIAQLGDDGDLRYSKRMKDDADIMWAWRGDEEAKESGIIHVKQHKARNLNPFPFSLKVEWPFTNIRDLKNNEVQKQDGIKGSEKKLKDIIGEDQ